MTSLPDGNRQLPGQSLCIDSEAVLAGSRRILADNESIAWRCQFNKRIGHCLPRGRWHSCSMFAVALAFFRRYKRSD